ncbi:hydroxymethylglutaryl-CoA reductase, degradative [Leptotrichia sp. OH3620_COT-345]|uniref:hydroxymethylglutaryl-CoA reductase, degradative n=1 Tax=Leptotrichia sp. OH3620_COT-345 TaxID=2491048 RepID=UPI000F64952B|nr:hydroxymethylglutaryl-CoA reductase, degradative [Leptotrichia sp. OH3620_COT-345]RRD38935.1 hydroxymethylglutaryl-CoA reductase, degradative [Leptotrichia sp. OH3620_COT-345]
MKTKKNIWLGFHNKSRSERIKILKENSFLNDEFSENLLNNVTLPCDIAEKISENNIGTLALPLGIAPNFLINGEKYTVPMVIEEPSVIAACSYAAKMISSSGGFYAEILNRKMTGQVILYNIENIEKAFENVLNYKEIILNTANEAYPSIVKRGGGAEDIRAEIFYDDNTSFLSVYLTVDVKEAMGANIINSMLEGIKSLLEKITGGICLMTILSNYADKSLVTSSCEIDIKFLSNDINVAVNIAKKIELASKFAKIDIYRAATHNKGIFNGIDAVVIAVGNDWRAIEAGGHAYAASSGKYKGLTTWTFDEKNLKLKGMLTLPMPIASVGGSIGLNPSVKAAFNILKNPDAKTLACIIVSVGLAQNLAALKALVTKGIQKGHMKLQAKSLALSVGAIGSEVEILAQKLTEAKHINLENAKKLLKEIRKKLRKIE